MGICPQQNDRTQSLVKREYSINITLLNTPETLQEIREILIIFNCTNLDIIDTNKNSNKVIKWEYAVKQFIQKICKKVYLMKNLEKKLRSFRRINELNNGMQKQDIKMPAWSYSNEYIFPLFLGGDNLTELTLIAVQQSPFMKLALDFFRQTSYPGGYYGIILNHYYSNIRIQESQSKKLASIKKLNLRKATLSKFLVDNTMNTHQDSFISNKTSFLNLKQSQEQLYTTGQSQNNPIYGTGQSQKPLIQDPKIDLYNEVMSSLNNLIDVLSTFVCIQSFKIRKKVIAKSKKTTQLLHQFVINTIFGFKPQFFNEDDSKRKESNQSQKESDSQRVHMTQMSNITFMSEVFKSGILNEEMENIDFKIKANKDIYDITYEIAYDRLVREYEVKIQENKIQQYKNSFRKVFKDFEKDIINMDPEETSFFQKEIKNKGIYDYVKTKLIRLQETRNFIEKLIIINQVVEFVQTLLEETQYPQNDENIILILYYLIQKKRGTFIDFMKQSRPLLLDTILLQKLTVTRFQPLSIDFTAFYLFSKIVRMFYLDQNQKHKM